MAIPYRTAKFKSANILLIAIWGSTAKFNARQYFRLYGITLDPMHTIGGDGQSNPATPGDVSDQVDGGDTVPGT